jgi:hypothetical protein
MGPRVGEDDNAQAQRSECNSAGAKVLLACLVTQRVKTDSGVETRSDRAGEGRHAPKLDSSPKTRRVTNKI